MRPLKPLNLLGKLEQIQKQLRNLQIIRYRNLQQANTKSSTCRVSNPVVPQVTMSK